MPSAQRPDEPSDPVGAAVRAAIVPLLLLLRRDAAAGRLGVAVALSGGRDSVVLLDALAALAVELPVAVSALHVHHGLSPNADAWAAFCAAECARRSIALTVHRARVARAPGESLEAAARAARYAAFAAADADVVALAHHADDQAETLLLQLLRGAGPHGLAAMPVRREGGAPEILRPLLALPRAVLERHAARRGLAWIDDESNADTGIRRNYLRHEIAPRLAAAFPGYPAALARSSAHCAEAARLLDELAALDAEGIVGPGEQADRDLAEPATLDRAALTALAGRSPARARNLLRWYLRQQGLVPPSTARLAAMLGQLAHAAPDARVRLAHDGVEIGIHRGRIALHAPAVAPFALAWAGECALALPHGMLEFAPAVGTGLAAGTLAASPVTVRLREGGERLRLEAGRSPRPLKRLLHDAGIPPWQREALPLVWCGNALAAVPGIGVDAAFRATAGAAGLVLRWHPAPVRPVARPSGDHRKD